MREWWDGMGFAGLVALMVEWGFFVVIWFRETWSS